MDNPSTSGCPDPDDLQMRWEPLPSRKSKSSIISDVTAEEDYTSLTADLVSVTSDTSVLGPPVDPSTRRKRKKQTEVPA